MVATPDVECLEDQQLPGGETNSRLQRCEVGQRIGREGDSWARSPPEAVLIAQR